MGIQEVGGKERIQEYPGRRKTGQVEKEGFQESLLQNLRCQNQGRESTEDAGIKAHKGEEKSKVGMMGGLAGVRVNTVNQWEAVQAAEVRHMSYGESDNIEIAVTRGYTLKGKMEGQSVYVEAKYEDGRVEAFHVDTAKVEKQTTHRIERFALETADHSSDV